MKINNFRGDLTDILATKEAPQTSSHVGLPYMISDAWSKINSPRTFVDHEVVQEGVWTVVF